VPAGTTIVVRTNDAIDLSSTADGRIYTGVVDQDVRDTNGNVFIPRGADAELIVRDVGNDERAVDLESITARGRRYAVEAADTGGTREQKEGLGKNQRTGKYVGGGAAVGAIIGAIAGGGKGAAIGAITGAAAGAGAQVITRGRSGKIPSESVLTFRLEQPMPLGTGAYSRDNGYQRNGNHYHPYGTYDQNQTRSRQYERVR
jgi:hypothetical protein